jgi:NADH:ubiquinone oxidoreductase subunit 5 (subunit L)/multisubunit Na+/H+ antiporter MnhA subunit
MACFYFLFKSLDFSVIFTLAPYIINQKCYLLSLEYSYLEFIGWLILLGAVGKSAQFGLHGWLPDAMEGPTPVSALIHAATLVTAGIFLIIRCSPILELTLHAINGVLVIGGLTCLFGSSVACVQVDIKRIVAFSTSSQLGYMMVCCGQSDYVVALFHLLNHGFFKALLFLSAGATLFSCRHEQDTRNFGGLESYLPFTFYAFFIGSLTLSGVPLLTGFYSKDVILDLGFISFYISGVFVY